jgi:hypothetical protein
MHCVGSPGVAPPASGVELSDDRGRVKCSQMSRSDYWQRLFFRCLGLLLIVCVVIGAIEGRPEQWILCAILAPGCLMRGFWPNRPSRNS